MGLSGTIPTVLGRLTNLGMLEGVTQHVLLWFISREIFSNIICIPCTCIVNLLRNLDSVLFIETLLLNPGLDQLTGPVPTEVCDLRRNFSLDNFMISSCHDMKCDCCHDHCPLLPNSNIDDTDDNGG